jgi:hypothetical protein
VVDGNTAWWGEDDVHVLCNQQVTMLNVTVTIQKTPGVSFSGQFVNAGNFTATYTENDSVVIFSYQLNSGAVLNPGTTLLIGSQYRGNGTPHPPFGDTFSVSATAAGVTQVVQGHF